MNSKEIEHQYEESLKEFEFHPLLAYIYGLSVRIAPIYKAFVNTKKWGNIGQYKEAQELLKNIALDKKDVSKKEMIRKQEALAKITPDTEMFGSLLGTGALDTCVLLLETFDAILEQDNETLISMASLPFNSVQMYIEELNDIDPNYKLYETFIFSHPLMVEEMEFQDKLRERLIKKKNIDEQTLEWIEQLPTTRLGNKLQALEAMAV